MGGGKIEINHYLCDMIDKFNRYLDMPEIEFWLSVCREQGTLRHYDRGEEFCHVGEVCRYVGYIERGSVRFIAYSADGTVHVVGFAGKGEFVADFPFSVYGTPARISVEACTGCDIYCVPVALIADMIKDDRAVADVVMKSTVELYSMVYDRYMSLYTLTPQERYNQLVSCYPDLFSQFPLKDIASFLHVTPTHLSRLRRNI